MLNDISFAAVKIHLDLAHLTGDVNPEGDSLITIQTIESLVKTDIIEALNLSTNRQKTVQDYISQCSIYLEKG